MGSDAPTGLQAIQQRLDEPATGEAVVRLLDRLDTIGDLVDKLEGISETIPRAVASAVDSFDDAAARGRQAGIDIDQRLEQGLVLAERLTQPDTLRVLTRLVDRIDRLEPVIDMIDQAPNLVSIAVDSLDDFAREGEARGIDVNARVRSTFALGERLTAPATVEALGNVLDPGAVSIVGMIGQTLVRCREECLSQPEPPRVSLWGLYKMTRTEDGQRALAFLKNFGRLWGEGIKEMHGAYRDALESNSEKGDD